VKRRLCKLVLLLVLGAIVNILIAWLIENLHGYNPTAKEISSSVMSAKGFDKVRLQLTDSVFPRDSYISVILEGHGYNLSVISVERRSYVSGETWQANRDDMFGQHVVIARVLSKNVEQRVVIYGIFYPPDKCELISITNSGLAQRIVGWPFKSLFYNPSYQVNSGSSLNPIITMTKEEKVWHTPSVISKLFPMTNELILPYGMWWPGFAINTIFYAVILWMLWSSPFAARRFIRSKRGLCIKCGYDLRGASECGCPECGWGREAEA